MQSQTRLTTVNSCAKDVKQGLFNGSAVIADPLRGVSSRGGFTLLELIIVMALAAMLSTIGIPRFIASVDRAETRSAAGKIAAAMRNARTFALSEKTLVTLVVDKRRRKVLTVQGFFDPEEKLEISDGSEEPIIRPTALPGKVEIWSRTGKYLTVQFNPRGTSTGAELYVTPPGTKSAYDRHGFVVTLDPLSGKAKVTPISKMKKRRRL